MIFVVETEERTLQAFSSEADAVAACEALDVEAGIWLFWSNEGEPLEPVFTVPNKRGLFAVRNGVYHLQPSKGLHHAHLAEAMEEVRTFAGPEPFVSAQAVKSHFERVARSG